MRISKRYERFLYIFYKSYDIWKLTLVLKYFLQVLNQESWKTDTPIIYWRLKDRQ